MPRNWEAEEIDREYTPTNAQIATNLTVTLLNAAHLARMYDRPVHAVLNRIRMPEHVIPHGGGPPERAVTEVILSYQRAP